MRTVGVPDRLSANRRVDLTFGQNSRVVEVARDAKHAALRMIALVGGGVATGLPIRDTAGPWRFGHNALLAVTYRMRDLRAERSQPLEQDQEGGDGRNKRSRRKRPATIRPSSFCHLAHPACTNWIA
jgi:hypothetical protein